MIKFCFRCGEYLCEYIGDRYDKFTGKKEVYLACSNIFCQEHCGTVIDHRWGKACLFQNWEKCMRCGYVICDY